MGTIYRFLASYEGLIYILLAIGALFSFRWILRSRIELREAVFGLEREYALRRISQAIALVVLLFALFIAELIIASFLAPGLPSADFMATPTLDLLDGSSGFLPSDDSSALPASSPVPVLAGPLGSGCIPGQLNLSSPTAGQEVRSTIKLEGTVRIENFGFYKYEVTPLGSNAWATISAGKEVVVSGELGLWDTSTLTPGDYELRLVAIDNQGETSPPCVVPVRVLAP